MAEEVSHRAADLPSSSKQYILENSSTPSATTSVASQYGSPYYLHHSDGTNLVLVSELLTEMNYTSWSQAMMIGFVVKNKVGFVDGSIPCPSNELKHSWIICNGVVIAWIFNALSKEISASINFTDSASEIWLDLQQRYQRKNRPRIFQLRREIANLTQAQASVTTYYAKMKSLWNELVSYRLGCTCKCCTCGRV